MAWYSRKKEIETRSTEECYNYFGSDGLLFSNLLNSYNNANLSAVFRSMELITDSIACLPIQIKFKNKKHKEVDENHPLNAVFDGHFLLIKNLLYSAIRHGNGFCYIQRGKNGDVVKLRYLPSDKVIINYNELNDVVSYTCPLISGKKIEAVNMIHIRKNTYDGVNGIGVFAYANKSMELAKACEEQARNFFSSGCNAQGIITVNSNLSDQQRKQIREAWQTAYGGGNSGVAVLQGNMSYQSTSVSSKDSQQLESRAFNVQELSRYFGVHPWLLGDTSASTLGSIEAIQLDFYLHTLMPYIQLMEDEFNNKLLKPSEKMLYCINFDDNYLIRTDKQAQANYLTTLLTNGIITPNEARVALGYNECDDPEMDKHHILYVDTNKTAIENETEENNNKEIDDNAED